MEYIRQVMEFQVCPIGIEAMRCISISGTVNYDRKKLLILAADGGAFDCVGFRTVQ